ncbi:hypothetical protein ACVDG5_014305 [Mesorhizobium sp. ORM6]
MSTRRPSSTPAARKPSREMLLAVVDENEISSSIGVKRVPYRLRRVIASGQMRLSLPVPSRNETEAADREW